MPNQDRDRECRTDRLRVLRNLFRVYRGIAEDPARLEVILDSLARLENLGFSHLTQRLLRASDPDPGLDCLLELGLIDQMVASRRDVTISYEPPSWGPRPPDVVVECQGERIALEVKRINSLAAEGIRRQLLRSVEEQLRSGPNVWFGLHWVAEELDGRTRQAFVQWLGRSAGDLPVGEPLEWPDDQAPLIRFILEPRSQGERGVRRGYELIGGDRGMLPEAIDVGRVRQRVHRLLRDLSRKLSDGADTAAAYLVLHPGDALSMRSEILVDCLYGDEGVEATFNRGEVLWRPSRSGNGLFLAARPSRASGVILLSASYFPFAGVPTGELFPNPCHPARHDLVLWSSPDFVDTPN